MNKETFEKTVEVYGQTLYRTARSLLKSDEDCKDALQEAVLKAWASLEKLREEDYFCTWLTRIVINECRNIQRRKAREIPSVWVKEASTPTDANEIMTLVDALPEKQRLAVALHYVEGLPVQEVAHILRVPRSTIRGRLFEARKALRVELTQEED